MKMKALVSFETSGTTNLATEPHIPSLYTEKRTHRLRVFEKRVLRGMFGNKRDEVRGKWRKLHNDNLVICTSHQILFR